MTEWLTGVSFRHPCHTQVAITCKRNWIWTSLAVSIALCQEVRADMCGAGLTLSCWRSSSIAALRLHRFGFAIAYLAQAAGKHKSQKRAFDSKTAPRVQSKEWSLWSWLRSEAGPCLGMAAHCWVCNLLPGRHPKVLRWITAIPPWAPLSSASLKVGPDTCFIKCVFRSICSDSWCSRLTDGKSKCEPLPLEGHSSPAVVVVIVWEIVFYLSSQLCSIKRN